MLYTIQFGMVLHIFIKFATAASENFEFELVNWDMSIAGLVCILERQQYKTERGWRFNTQGCEELPDSWFGERTIQDDEQYFVWSKYENVFERTAIHSEDFPAFFHVGCTVRLYVHTAIIFGSNSRLGLKFWMDPSFMPFSYGIGYYYHTNVDHFISLINNVHEARVFIPRRVTEADTIYKIDFLYTAAEYQVYVDDVHLENFARRHTDKVDVPNYFECKNDNSGECLRIVFLCPVTNQ